MLSSIFTVSLAQSAIELGCIYGAGCAGAVCIIFNFKYCGSFHRWMFYFRMRCVCHGNPAGSSVSGTSGSDGAGVISGFVTAFLQTRLGVESILAGIIVNTGLYTINIAVMGFSSTINLFANDTIFTLAKDKIGWKLV